MATNPTPTLPNVPYKSQVTDKGGFINEAWAKFFRELFTRVGANIALSNTQLAGVSTSAQANITALQTLTTAQTAQIVALQSEADGLSVGPLP